MMRYMGKSCPSRAACPVHLFMAYQHDRFDSHVQHHLN